MSPLEERADLFTAKYNIDNVALWGKGQTLVPTEHFRFLKIEVAQRGRKLTLTGCTVTYQDLLP